jgi:3-deoxy-manno-octulosonate cytidylyltransferase (CMP-KDO synthetase)
MLRALGVIPARYASTRFRGKPLAPLGDDSMVGCVWRRASASKRLEAVVVATDDDRILAHCREIGATVRLTSPAHASGTDRVQEVVRDWPAPVDVVVNLQGDEPLVTGTALDRLVAAFDDDPELGMATLSEPLESIEEALSPDVVKVVTDGAGRALYFSRSPIPYPRDSAAPGDDARAALARDPGALARLRKHQGIYAYRRSVLATLTSLPPSPLERAESLEQLRALEAGIAIRVLPSDFRSVGVDTPADLERAAALLSETPETVTAQLPKEPDR